MKKIIAFVLCMLLALPCAAMAEEPAVDLDALWARLASYKADLESEQATKNADIQSLTQDIATLDTYIAYYKSMQDYAKTQLAAMQQEVKDLAADIDAVDTLLNGERSEAAAQQVQAMLPPPNLTGKHYIQIDVANYGVITAELDADAAPITVTNFMKLVEEGFYNGLTFHRIISGFVIQGGDPLGNGQGGSSKNIKGEFTANGVNNTISHERGVLSMARANDYNSASSQFFIVHQQATNLDGQYAAFGHVLTGMEVVDAICTNTPVTDSNGTVAKENQPVITSIVRIEAPAAEAPAAE